MMRRLLVMLVLLAACGGSSDGGGAEAATVRHYEQVFAGQWGRLYDALHPEHQQLIPRDDFMACAPDVMGVDIDADEIEAVDSYEEKVTIPFTEVEADSTAVTVEITATLQGETERVKRTSHVVDVDDEWRWYLATPSDFRGCGETEIDQ